MEPRRNIDSSVPLDDVLAASLARLGQARPCEPGTAASKQRNANRRLIGCEGGIMSQMDFITELEQVSDPKLREALEKARDAYQDRFMERVIPQDSDGLDNNSAGVVHEDVFIAPKHLFPERRNQPDFFVLDLIDYAFKGDVASMETPLFSLATKKDTSPWYWQSEDGAKKVEVTCNATYGRATQHDKDILIYCMSQITEAINHGTGASRTVRFTAYDFLKATNRNTYGDDYDRLRDALNRLRGTSITTDVRTGGQRITKGFGIIDSWETIEKSPTNNRMVAVEITLSKWLWNGITAHEVLTIHPDYFRLRKPLERRLYEIARKHVGRQGIWIIALESLHKKSGSRASQKEFMRALREIIAADTLPDYRYHFDENGKVYVYARNGKMLADRLGKRIPKNPKRP
ncbi:MAG: replication initiator protein A [Acidobacteriaceae bacterium]